MTIGSTTVCTSGSTGNGATTSFSFGFSVEAYGAVTQADQIEVIKQTIASGVESILTLSADYTAAFNADQNTSPGGSITMTAAPSSAYKIFIRLAPSFLQATDYQSQGGFLMETVEDQDDQLSRQILVLKDALRRSPYLSPTVGASFDGKITGPFTAGYGVIVNGAGTGFTLGALTSATVSASMAPVVSAGSLGAGRIAFSVPGLADVNTFTNQNKFVVPYNTTGDTAVEIINGTSGNPVTTVQSKYSGLRVERYLNKTGAGSSTQEYGVQADSLSSGSFVAFKTSGSQQTFALKGLAFIGTPRTSGIGSNTDTVGLYGEGQRTTGSDGIWGGNILVEVTNLNGATIGLEIDWNNRSTSDPGVSLTNSPFGLSIVNGDQYRGGTAIIINRNGSYSNNEWNRGLYVKEYKKVGIEIGTTWAGGTNAALLAAQNADGEDVILLRRKTDTTPTGYFFRAVNFGNDTNLILWGIDGALTVNSSIKSNSATAGLGYATGAGGAVTQITSRSTGVTLSKVSGAITTDTTSLAAEASATFTVTNTTVAATDTVIVSIKSGANGGNTAVTVAAVGSGSFDLKVSNNNAAAGTAETGAIVINFAVVKAVAA